MVHPCMVDVRYLQLYHTHYSKEHDIGELMLTAQKESFLNEGNGTEIPDELMHLLHSTSSNTTYPLLGKSTTEGNLVEATFALDRSTTTVMDIERVRACDPTEDYEGGHWTGRKMNDGLCAKKNSSQQNKLLKHRIKLSLGSTKEPTDEEKRFLRPNEEELDDFYWRWSHFLSELTKVSRTTLHKVEHAETTMQTFKDELATMTLDKFPPSNLSPHEDGSIMAGYYGNNSPQKSQKRQWWHLV